jgi:adenosylmethionine-8-amino-7-oxononanoate aminotransferase
MWYSACNFGYKNERINNAIKDQLDRMGQLASQFLFEEKVILSKKLVDANQKKIWIKGKSSF